MNTLILTKKEVLLTIKKNQDKIKDFGIKRLGLFGSFLHENQSDDSDIDFLIEFEKGKKTFRNFMDLSFFLEDLFNRSIELVTVESLSPYISPNIMKEVEYVTFTS